MKRRLPPSTSTAPSPIPALSDAAMERIERGVFAALDARAIRPDAAPSSRRRVLAVAFAGATLTAAAFGVREWRHVEAPARTAEVTTTTSGSHIDIAGAALDVAPQSAVSVGGGKDGAVVVVLQRGAVTFEVAPRSKQAPFVVEAGQTRVTVIGTRFTVRRVGDHATVSVEHGLVEVADTNMTELVHAGVRFPPGEPITREPLASSEATAPPPAAAAAPAPAEAHVEVPAPKRVTMAAPPARTPHRRQLAMATEAARAADAPSQVETPSAAIEKVAVTEKVAASDGPASAAGAEAAAPAADAEGSAPRRSVQVLFELAAQLEIRDPAAALRIYGELANGQDGWAASALFASARLEQERGQTDRARTLGEAYLRRFPRGPNADDARALLQSAR
jgi:hypothetical protein